MQRQNKLRLTITNTVTGRSAEIHFPLLGYQRRRYFEELKLTKDNYLITSANFHIKQVNDVILKHDADLNEIAFFCLLYFHEMQLEACKTFDILVKSGYVQLNSTKDLLNILHTLDNYYIIEGASIPSQVAQAYLALASEFGCQPWKELTEEQLDYTGKKIATSEKGIFFEGNYIALYPTSPPKEKPPVEIPDCVKLFK